jgi:hypothetical protein
MELRIKNSTEFVKIKLSIYHMIDNDGINEFVVYDTKFLDIKDIINLDVKTDLILSINVYIVTVDNIGYNFYLENPKFLDDHVLYIKIKDGKNYPVLTINSIKPTRREKYDKKKCVIM